MATGSSHLGSAPNRVFIYREIVDRRAVRKVPGRRRTMRYKYAQPCLLHVSRGNSEIAIHATSGDLSELGIRLSIPADLLPGEIVSIQLPLDTYNETLSSHGIVRRRDDSTYGIDFLDLKPDQRLTLRMLLHSSPGKPLSSNIPPWL
jgi:hypothetical protein